MAIGKTPCSMVYGSEAVLPIENGVATICIQAYTMTNNEVIRMEDLDLVKERSIPVAYRMEYYRSRVC